MGLDLALLILYVGGALSISFTCSVLEATLLSARVAELSGRASQGQRGAAILLELKQNRVDDAISAILTLNTVAHTIGAAMAGAQAAVVFGDPWVGAFSGVLTLLVLVFTEIIPKTLGTAYASRLAGPVGRTIRVLMIGLAPILVVTRFLTRLVAPHQHQPVSRAELSALVAMATREGTLQANESQVLANTLRLDEVRVAEVMTPRTVALMLPAASSLAELLARPADELYSRIPLFGRDRDDVQGYAVLRDLLDAAARGADPGSSLGSFARPAWFLPETTPISQALKAFLSRREHLALVTDEFDAVVGLVTMEDIVETVLGREIMDESDRVADLRSVAARLRDQRMQRRRAAGLASSEPVGQAPEAAAEGAPEPDAAGRSDG